MNVLDFIRNTEFKQGGIEIPPFHTGHLGLVPPMSVDIGLMSSSRGESSHCELIVSANGMQTSRQDLAVLTCTLKDGVGVVSKVVEALSDLEINILTKANSSINHLDNHSLTLLLDLSTSNISIDRLATKKSSRNFYKYFRSLFPIDDYRYMRIFESLVVNCAESISWNKVSGLNLPSISIKPLGVVPTFKKKCKAQLVRSKASSKSYYVNLELPQSIKSYLDLYFTPTTKLYYILLSDTIEKNLRVFFPKPEIIPKILHVGFYHNNIPKALNAILRILALSKFNILTGVLRNDEHDDRSVWEAILEYRGGNEKPGDYESHEMCEWLKDKLESNCKGRVSLEKFNVEIGLPQYPKPKKPKDRDLRVPLKCFTKSKKDDDSAGLSSSKVVKTKITSLKKSGLSIADQHHTRELLKKIEKRLARDTRPTIFLSYPTPAKKIADHFKGHFKDSYQIDDYQQPDGNVILEKVREKIQECDVFVGIWIEDELFPHIKDKKFFNVSPWMLFEYGIAFDDRKPILLLQSEKVHDNISQRINPSRAHLKFYNHELTEDIIDTVEERLYRAVVSEPEDKRDIFV